MRGAAFAQGLVIGCVAEVDKGAEDASVFALGGIEFGFGKDAGHVFFDGGLADQRVWTMPWLDLPSAHGGVDVAFAGAEAFKGVVALAAAEHPSDHFGLQRAAAAGGDAGDGVDEALDITDALSGVEQP